MSLYDDDFHAWTREQARKLRGLKHERSNTDLDLDHLAEEIEDLGKNDVRALEKHVARVIEHLLKLEWSPAQDPRAGWEDAVALHRLDARSILEDSPGLRQRLDARLDRCFEEGRRLAIRGLLRDGVRGDDLPKTCPYDLATQILSPDWFPPPR